MTRKSTDPVTGRDGGNRAILNKLLVLAIVTIVVTSIVGAFVPAAVAEPTDSISYGPDAAGVGQIVPAVGLLAAGLAGYYVYVRWIKGSEPPTIQIRGRVK